MAKYDFIIFEHSGLRNHFVDLCKIGKMLQECRYSVAIANVTLESEYCADSGLEIIHLIAERKRFVNKSEYMKAVFEEIAPLTRNIYAGSILCDTDLCWLKYVPSTHKVFMWALRAFFFTSHKRFYLSKYYPQEYIRSYKNLCTIKKYKNIRLFVSEPIIIKEFEDLGIESYRMVLRPERTCDHLTIKDSKHESHLELLSMGALRPEKRVDLCIEALNQLNDRSLHFTIAGKAYTTHGYDRKIDSLAEKSPYVSRIPNRLETEEYNKLISDCDYFVLCDESQPSCVTNGTMAEALLAGKPIIAPNYNPYKYYIEKYNIGILYEMHNVSSLKAAILKAKNTPYPEFVDGLRRYQECFMYQRVADRFSFEITETLKR